MVPNEQTSELQLQRWSLEDAANKVGVSKKSLDDYLLQLRFGKKFGFDPVAIFRPWRFTVYACLAIIAI